ncbi:hypothetical protein D3C77_748280 [compost metagenome]
MVIFNCFISNIHIKWMLKHQLFLEHHARCRYPALELLQRKVYELKGNLLDRIK